MNIAKKLSHIAIGQIQIQPENLHYQEQQIMQIIKEAKDNRINLLIFPAFSTTGYLPADATLFPDFYEDCQALDRKIAAQAAGITIIWGSVTYQAGQVTPTIFLAENSNITFSTTPNRQYANYDVCIDEEEKISFSFSWNTPQKYLPTGKETEKTHHLELVFYANPRQELKEQTAAAASSTLYLHNAGLAYEEKQIFVLPGNSKYTMPENEKILSVPFSATGLFPLAALTPQPDATSSQISSIYEKTIYGIRAFMANNHLQKVVIGLSGGIDSALNACLYQQAIGAENVLLINMPSRYNSQLTQSLAKNLSEKLGCHYGVFPIEEAVNATVGQLENTPLSLQGNQQKLTVSSFTGENIQARDRGSRILAAIAQCVSGVFTANCNKTEITVGYATMYGDQAGFLAATGNLWKHEVYALAQYMDNVVYRTPVLKKIIDLKPSAELSPAQDITKGLGDPLIYDYHDRLLAAWEDRETPLPLAEILCLYEEKQLGAVIGCPQAIIDEHFPTAESFINDLEKWWQAYAGMANVKRLQSPPILIVHNPPKSQHLHRLHSPYFSPEYLKLKADLLK